MPSSDPLAVTTVATPAAAGVPAAPAGVPAAPPTQTGRNGLACPECKRTFSKRKYLNYHIRWECGRQVICSQCQLSFRSVSRMQSHMKKCSGSPYTCCNRNFKDAELLANHKRWGCGQANDSSTSSAADGDK